MENNKSAPILIPYETEVFWDIFRKVIREEIHNAGHSKTGTSYQTPGLTYKPLYKITEVCSIFGITRQTIYDWIKHEKLKPYKVRSRVYFLWSDIQALVNPSGTQKLLV